MQNTHDTTYRILSANCNVHLELANTSRLDAISTMNESLAMTKCSNLDFSNVHIMLCTSTSNALDLPVVLH